MSDAGLACRYDTGITSAARSFVNRIPPVTQALLWAMAIMYLLQQVLEKSAVLLPLVLWPLGVGDLAGPGVGFMPWQLVTYGFLHGNLMHLFFNCIALFQFGAPLEQAWGGKRFAQYFFVCVVGAGLIQLAVASSDLFGVGRYPTIGASGGVFGILLAFGMLFPYQRVMLLLPPVEMSARTLVIVFGVIELLIGVTGLQTGVAHFAHLGGMLFGWLLIRYWRGQPPFSRRKPPPPKKRHLRSV
jgi:membrane associated rhomboid family serine protease